MMIICASVVGVLFASGLPGAYSYYGMIERFNGRIADVLRTTRFDSAASLQATLKHFVYLYNHRIPQKNLLHKTPLQALIN